jgi:hypothetical protein
MCFYVFKTHNQVYINIKYNILIYLMLKLVDRRRLRSTAAARRRPWSISVVQVIIHLYNTCLCVYMLYIHINKCINKNIHIKYIILLYILCRSRSIACPTQSTGVAFAATSVHTLVTPCLCVFIFVKHINKYNLTLNILNKYI